MKYQLKQLGQGMTEYIIIVALIAIAGIGAFTFFGDGLKQTIGSVTEELTGKDTTIVNSDKTDDRIKETRDMGDFNLSDK
ncbi:MAG: Flp pilus assembly pilin Flp [Gammaproteobacteria bacterium]|jgi:Flp pilus assembly pilin Flp